MRNKIKSCKSASKRFRITGSGKIVYMPAGHSHHMEKKGSRDKKAQLTKRIVGPTDYKNVRLRLPNVKL